MAAACGTARYTDTAPSGTSLEDASLLQDADPVQFATAWLGPKSKQVAPRIGAAVEFQIVAHPPARPGYRNVGMREADDALGVFNRWCTARGGKTQWSLLPATSYRPVQPLTVCSAGGDSLAAIGTSKSRESATEPVVVSVFLITPKSVRDGRERAFRAAEAEYEAQRRERETAEAFQRNFDAAYRSHLKVGDYVSWAGTVSHTRINGLVVDIKAPIALVQFSELGSGSTIWLRIEELGAPR
jgi:hypothetical protein